MVYGVQLKVCGLTSVADARAAAAAGAGFLGFIFYPQSPRALTIGQYLALAPELPAGPRRVAVLVEPGLAEITTVQQAGFDSIQVHFPAETPAARLREWSELIGPARLWLAPRLPPEQDMALAWLPLAETFLLDTFHADKFGGTGRTGDWAKFRRHQAAHPGKNWILSGGLAPGNLAAAVAASGARLVDVNSGVESAPGVKDPAKLQALAAALS